MKLSEAWLRERVNPAISTDELVAQLTMAGLEVDSVEPAAAVFSGVVVGEVVAMEQHPDADRLRVCTVNTGEQEPLQIVCGAANVRVGLKIPAALVGAVLPGDFKIKKSKLRGVESFGMLCSEKELGLAEEASGLMELATGAPVGVDIRDYLTLNDNLIEVDLTPNRADCLSVEGIAREVSVLNQMDLSALPVVKAPISHSDELPVSVAAEEACPRYLGRLIKAVDAKTETPLWMQERLRRSGLRSLGPLVDVTNYVLLEIGQPLHAFDLAKLSGGIHVRWAHKDETLELLNNQSVQLDTDALVIADEQRALALAGIMGGSSSAVNDETQDVFLECAFFTPDKMMGKARKYGLHTDSSHRFERGVDPFLQERAIERATQLILEIAGGSAGPITERVSTAHLPERQPVTLRRQKLDSILAVALDDAEIIKIFTGLGMRVESYDEGWQVTPPGFRFDITIEADLIEELARVYGYNRLPQTSLLMRSELSKAPETVVELDTVKDALVARDYQEVITYSFVDEQLQQAITPGEAVVRLQNPLSSELAVMRSSLWCGLIQAALYNINRQQARIRLFESGLRFLQKQDELVQQKMLAGLVLGEAYSEQWSEKRRKVDFFDVKADVEGLFALTGNEVRFVKSNHPALHPGQTAEIQSADGEPIGWLGMLHPKLEDEWGIGTQVFLFELDQTLLLKKKIPAFSPLSKFPSVRRDLALLVNESCAVADIVGHIKDCSEAAIQDIFVFDIYQGQGIEPGYKSVALGLILQDFSQTLTEPEIDAIVSRVLKKLTTEISARLRD